MQDKSEGPENIGGYDGSYAQSQQIPERPQLSTTSPLEAQHDGNYYSPDEIGKNRISTIWEESPTRSSKEKRVSHNPDGSFLGCKEINGPAPTNPDDVLLFASGEDSTTLQPRPLAIGAKKRLKEKASRAPRKSEEKTGSPDEGQRTSQSLNHPLCSRQSSATMCQDFAPQREAQSPESQSSSKENCRPETSMDIQIEHPLPDGVNEDDVFIITPTITRTLIPTPGSANLPKPEKKGFTFKPQGLRRPGGTGYSGTGEAVKAIRAKAQVISTPSMLQPATGLAQKKSTAPSLASSSLPVPKDTDAKGTATLEKEKPGKPKESTKVKESLTRNGNSASSSIRGFIRTTGLAKSTSTGKSPTGSLATILRNGTESLRNRAENLRNGTGSFTSRKGSPVSLPTRDNSESSRSERSFKSAKETATDASPSSTKTSSTKKANLTSKLSIGKESPTEKATPADTTEEQTPIAKPLNVDKDKENPVGPDPLPVEKGDSSPKSEKLSRSERLEKFKEQARLRRAAANAAKAKISDKPVEIAELDGEQVPGLKETLQPNITDVEELRDINAKDKDDIASSEAPNAVVLSLFFQTVFLFVTKIHRLTLQIPNNPYLKFGINNVLSMSTHCYDVFNCIYRAISEPGLRPRNDQAISRFMVEVLQACVYLVILGFGVLVIGRAVRYLLLFGSWLLWFATPVVWVFRGLTRALIS
ncbi:hypothetical protein N7470_001384 [Penicillium chermesinum]|nr:hypothetical protein N7470_001384 [Penicillium chermesinum]